MIGRPESGRARNASISLPRSATMGEQVLSFSDWRTGAGANVRGCENVWPAPQDAPGTETSSAGKEEGGQPRLDILRDFLTGAVLGIAQSALAGETLIAAGNIVGDVRERGSGHHRLVGGVVDQIVLGVDAVVFASRQTRIGVGQQIVARGGESY